MTDKPSKSAPMERKEASTAPAASTAQSQIDAFLAQVGVGGRTSPTGSRGRLIFALDATASRQEAWNQACQLQAGMFREVASIGGLDVQLCYFRGMSECQTSRWVSNPERLQGLMEKITCQMGHTQIGKVLAHARKETQLLKVQALVYVGDAMEENPDDLFADANELGRMGTPAFMFQEGHDREVERVFRQIAKVTHGAYFQFDAGSAKQLAQLLKAVAVFATGGIAALTARNDAGAIKLLGQLK